MTIADFTIIVNSASTAAPIGLPPKMSEFCHTSNRSLLGRQCHRALLRLYFNSSATGWRSVVGGRWSVGNKGCRALGGSLQKDKGYRALGGSLQKDKGCRALGGSLQKDETQLEL